MPIIKWVAELLGLLMNGIYYVISKMGFPNVAFAIILFTIILLMAMMPLTIRQQRFSKLNAIMQPEIQKIQKKYKGKKDQVSQQKMMDEMNAVYSKYGVSQMGSCIQMLIQLPVLFGLYQVIYKIPGYITVIGSRIQTIAENEAFLKVFKTFVKSANNSTLTRNYAEGATKNVIDAVYGLNTNQWSSLMDKASGSSFESELTSLHSYVNRATDFFGLNISDSPWDIIKNAWSEKAIILIIVAIAFPILAWLTQWLNYKLMPQPNTKTGDESQDQMMNTMNSMNNIMPVMSAFFCLTLPTGVGIYWIMSAVIRMIQQVLINKKLDSESVEDIVAQAQKKAEKKRTKEGLPPQKITNAAHTSTRTVSSHATRTVSASSEKERQRQESSEAAGGKTAKPGSLASKANMVREYDKTHAKDRTKYKK